MIRVLFVGARPRDQQALALRSEVEKIIAGVYRAKRADHVQLEDRWTGRFLDLTERLIDEKPDIVHFSGHGTADSELVFENDQGDADPIPPDAVASLFSAAVVRRHVRCVVLNACYGASLAEELANQIDFVIGCPTPMLDAAAIAFSDAFYQTLARGECLQDALDLGVAQFRAKRRGLAREVGGLPDATERARRELPRLFVREGADPRAWPASPSLVTPSVAAPLHNLRPRNRDFRGRGDELTELDRTLRDEKRTTITHASVFGLGGVGKTALALEYAHRAVERGDYPGGVWWVRAEGNPMEALGNLAPVLRAHGPPEVQKALAGDETQADRIADLVRLALQAQRARSLLVLDNVSERGWGAHVPEGEVRVLLTTREEGLSLGTPRRLEVLPPAQAREVAEAIAGEAQGEAEVSAQQRVLVTELGGLAVAVEMAARAVKAWFRGSWSAYERVLRQEMDRVLMDPKLVGDYGRGVFAALDLSLDRCDAEARALLEGAAVFAPEAVPLRWALAAAGLTTEGAAAQAKATLNELGLVTENEAADALSLHRLVHRQVRRRAELERTGAWLEASRRGVAGTAEWTMSAIARNQTQAEMQAIDAHREHLDQALEGANRVGSDVAWIRIADAVATHLHNRARNVEALALLEQALAKAEQLVPPEPVHVSTTLANLAMVFYDLGEAARSRPLLERALSIAEKTFGPEHPNVATVLSNLALVLRTQGDAAGARPLLNRAFGLDEKTFGPEHPIMAIRLSNLALVLKTLGDAAGAKPLLERALHIDEKTFGPEHPNVGTTLSNLAVVLLDLGDAGAARPLLERALGLAEKTFGPEHPNVANRLSNLAVVLRALGDAAGARPLLERALGIDEKNFGPEHPSVGTTLSNLAMVLKDLGDAGAARPLLERALGLAEKTFGPEHPKVANRLSNLAMVLKDLGNAGGARALLERALTIVEARLPPGHPHQGIVRRNLASLDPCPPAAAE